jgi:DNA polymerase-3 subunit gamma/tau
MLTKEAFNALLKTLEEPPAHVIFILATTEAHKLPETIISRTQRFAFKPVEITKVASYLQEIATSESIAITEDALELVAQHGDGSFRDSISLLDQARNHDGEVTKDDVQRMLGIAPQELIAKLIIAMSNSDGLKVAEGLAEIQDQGYEPAQVAKQLGAQLRTELLAGKRRLPNNVILSLLGRLVTIPASPDPRSALEISLLDVALATTPAASSSAPTAATRTAAVATPPTVSAPAPRPTMTRPQSTPTPVAAKVAEVAEQPKNTKEQSGVTLDPSIWPEILKGIKGHHNTLYGIIRTTQPHFGPGEIILECEHAFSKKQLDQTRNREIIGTTIEQLTGEVIFVQCILGNGPLTPLELNEAPVAVVAPADNPLASVSNIFGGGELIES